MASQFFNELDLLSDHSEVVVLGATNREDLLDPALLRAGRLDFVLRFNIPDESERLEIFAVHCKGKPLAADVDLQELAAASEGMAGSDIASVCKKASILSIVGLINGKKSTAELFISAAHFRTALEQFKGRGVV